MAIIRDLLAASNAKAEMYQSGNEKELLAGYNEALFRKLEKKMADLEKINRELQESEQNFRQFVMQCPIPIAISDLQGNMELLNSRFVEILGFTLEDIPHTDAWWLKAYPDPVYRKEVSEAWQQATE
ncbi:MAG TPA: PAS domain-containing protein, partial [Petrotogaceae bacterium]|nr:PAS domain-containing protein [Petrotogaceae bacterium]